MTKAEKDAIRARTTEVWLDVAGYEGYYQVSNYGRIRSLDRIIQTKHLRQRLLFAKGALLTPSKRNRYGHLNVTLRKNGVGITKQLHRLVAAAFLPNPSNSDMIIRHLNGNPTDNSVNNLAWGTYHQNEADKISHGTALLGEKNRNAKLSNNEVREIRRLLQSGLTGTQVAKRFCVGTSEISDIKTGKRWGHVV